MGGHLEPGPSEIKRLEPERKVNFEQFQAPVDQNAIPDV
jgi:hypothetical protein